MPAVCDTETFRPLRWRFHPFPPVASTSFLLLPLPFTKTCEFLLFFLFSFFPFFLFSFFLFPFFSEKKSSVRKVPVNFGKEERGQERMMGELGVKRGYEKDRFNLRQIHRGKKEKRGRGEQVDRLSVHCGFVGCGFVSFAGFG